MAKKNIFSGELIHFAATRIRVTGAGNLLQVLRSLDNVHTYDLVDVVLTDRTNREPTTLANYIDQRGQLEIRTIEIDEIFNISNLIIYIKPVATGYPD